MFYKGKDNQNLTKRLSHLTFIINKRVKPRVV